MPPINELKWPEYLKKAEKMPRHRKVYHKYTNGVSLWCGSDLIKSSSYRSANWQIDSCPGCGMEVQTTGNSPETDKISELSR